MEGCFYGTGLQARDIHAAGRQHGQRPFRAVHHTRIPDIPRAARRGVVSALRRYVGALPLRVSGRDRLSLRAGAVSLGGQGSRAGLRGRG